jgi:DNA-binding transcriptional LysR family regulator
VDDNTPAAPLRYDNRITLQKLEVFCLVVELGGVTRAADQLWVAQSVVSGHLRSLQERLGVRVLYRDGQQLKLTKAGEQVHQWASETLSRTRELMRDLDEVGNSHIAIAASLAVGNYLLPPILADFRRDWSGAAITMSVSDPDQTFDAVEKGECDLGIIIAETGHEHPHLRSEVLGYEEILLVAAPASLPGTDAVSLADLASLALVAPSAGTVPREAVDRQLTERGAPPQNVVMELGHPEAMKRVIRSGLDACLLFRSCVEDDLKQGTLREIVLTDARLSLPVLSVEHVDRPRRPIQDQLVEQTRAYLAARTT